MRERVAERMTNEVAGFGVADKVSLSASLAPLSLRIPVPRLHMQLGVLTIADRLPTRGEDLVHDGFGENLIGGCGADAIDSRSERHVWNKGLHDVTWGDVNPNRLR